MRYWCDAPTGDTLRARLVLPGRLRPVRRLPRRVDRGGFARDPLVARAPHPGYRAAGRASDLPVGHAVDVGCGRGDLAGLLVDRGWRVTGVEPSASACRAARRRGVDARQGTLHDVELDSGAYDAAIFRHSLEHSADLAGDLATVVRALKPGGLVLITVPNFECWQRRRFGNRWYHLDLPRHRVHLTTPGLRAALNRAGAEVESFDDFDQYGRPACDGAVPAIRPLPVPGRPRAQGRIGALRAVPPGGMGARSRTGRRGSAARRRTSTGLIRSRPAAGRAQPVADRAFYQRRHRLRRCRVRVPLGAARCVRELELPGCCAP